MSEISDRIIRRMKDLSLKQTDLVKATGLSKGTVSKWVSGVNTPSADVLPALAKALQTTSDWIISGGDSIKFIENQSIEVWDENTPLDDDEVEIPYFDNFSFACGHGSVGEAMANQTSKLRLAKLTLRNLGIQHSETFAARASGESMSPTIKDGDTVHVDMGKKIIKDGKVFAICHGGLLMIKRLYNLPLGGVRIVSDNAIEFPEVRLSAQQIKEEEFEIVGWVWQVSSLDTW